MTDISGFSLESIRDYILLRGGSVTNHDLVKHFRNVLTDPATRDEARVKFKEYVNAIATINRDADGSKQLVLKRRYRQSNIDQGIPSPNPSNLGLPLSPLQTPALNLQYQPVYASHDSLDSYTSPLRSPYRRASQDSLYSNYSMRSPSTSTSQFRNTPPPTNLPLRRNASSDSMYLSTQSFTSDMMSPKEVEPPPVPPRRRSSDKRIDEPKFQEIQVHPVSAPPTPVHPHGNKENVLEDSKISVKERSQKFDRMASESALNKVSLPNKKKQEKADKDEDDTGSVTILDSKTRLWLVKCSQCDYQAIVKMAAENPKFVRFRDPTCGTALHWAAKHGNADVIKLIAGTHNADVNARTNGGYTPLHIAMQYGRDDVYNLLVEVYGADTNLRDWSGKKPRQYQTNKNTSVSIDTYRKIKARKKHAEKDLGFLRIGSLNVRVKRTTEAFSNFLGVGNAEKIHKNWGSADNLPQNENKKMPPPKFASIKKRKSKRGHQDFARTIEKPKETPAPVVNSNTTVNDSDSDAGFGSNWQTTV